MACNFRGFRLWLIIILVISISSCRQTEHTALAVPYRVELALGTVCTVTLYEQGKNSVYNAIFSRIREIENLMSVNIPSSDISRINDSAGIAPVQVNKETFAVIERALFFAHNCGGAFDPSVGPLVSLWGIGTEDQRVPSQEEINHALSLVNWRNVILNESVNSTDEAVSVHAVFRVYLTERFMALDLGAIAKGYAADEAARIAASAGIKSGIIDLGGNIVIIGEKKDRSPWRVGIQKPDIDNITSGETSRGEIIGFLQLTQSAEKKLTVVTSGIYERFFIENGIHRHHIFSPSLGYPVQNGLVSVSIIAENSMDADALSTAVFVLGYDKGRSLLESYPVTGAVFIFDDKSVIVTGAADFTLTDNTFYIK